MRNRVFWVSEEYGLFGWVEKAEGVGRLDSVTVASIAPHTMQAADTEFQGKAMRGRQAVMQDWKQNKLPTLISAAIFMIGVEHSIRTKKNDAKCCFKSSYKDHAPEDFFRHCLETQHPGIGQTEPEGLQEG